MPPEVVIVNFAFAEALTVAGMTKINFVAELDLTLALTPFTLPVALVKLVPTTVTVPTPRFVLFDCTNEVIFGAGGGVTKTVNECDAVPPSVVTTTVVEPTATDGTVNLNNETEASFATTAFTPATVTLAPVKFVPVIVTDDPTLPEVGLIETIVGAGGGVAKTVND